MGSGYDRVPSGGSMYSRGGSFGNMGPPPPPDYFPQQYPPQQYDSWGRMPSGGPPPPVPQMYGGNRSADFDREHSLATNPLQNATMDHPADQGMFEQRGGSGYWGPPPSMGGQPSMPPPQMSSPSPGYDRCMSGGNYSSSGQQAYDPNALPMNNMLPPQVKPSNYQVSSDIVDPWSNPNATQFDNTGSVFGNGMGGRPGGNLVRPDMVKRMTSNQNEDLDTKRDLRGPSIKRATLSRDSSAAAARLKELQFPNMPKRPFNTQEEINFISSAVEQSTLVPEPISDMNKPELERTSTVDEIARVLGPPEPLSHSNRSSTVDALLEVTGMNDQHISRPPTLRTEGRLSTAEYLDIVNEPIGLDEADARNTKPIDLATLDEEADNVSKWLGQG
mmetsp:Transcript_23384/g.33534  ORF Transcript_23384/g.33534 Transcript_23384/m.33534 type:complete len:389 (+) Transcript_23384:332-1498(+)